MAGAPAPAVLPLAPGKNGLLVILLGLYGLLLTVPIAEMLARLGARTFAPLIVGTILTIGLLSTGKVFEFWKLPVAKPYMLFLVLAILAGGAGYYPSRSLNLVLEYGIRFHILAFFCCAMALTTRQLRHVYSWIGLGAFALLALCVVFGEMADDRLIIKDTTLANPNDLGFAIVFSMTGLLAFRSRVFQILSLLSLPLFLLYILKTGSRADLLTIIGLALMACFFAPAKWRIALLVGLPVVAGGVLLAVPGETRARLMSVFGSNSTGVSAEVMRAADSTAARGELQMRAIELAIRHPLLGVGATNFEDAVDQMVQMTLHTKSGWQVAHNTYLQIAAENGYPAFICYVWCLIASLRLNYRSYKICRARSQLAAASAQSFALMMMTTMFIICTAFSNNSFDPHFNLVVGLTAANYLAIQRESAAVPADALLTQTRRESPAGRPRRELWNTRPRPRSLVTPPLDLPMPIGRRRPV
jgi:hypothetical protein